MGKVKMCIICNSRPIAIKKREMCTVCYQRTWRRGHGLNIKTKNFTRYNSKVHFIQNYFDHTEWSYEPATFRLTPGKYTPDFYDKRRNVFIEVVGTRQAYHQNKEKYIFFNKEFPRLTLELRSQTGEIYKK